MPQGDCYEAAARLIIESDFLGEKISLTLIHGFVTGQGKLEGVVYGHAWVEDKKGNVLDYSNDRKLVVPKELYYSIGKIDHKKQKRYSSKETRKMLNKYEHWGPWE